MAMEGDSSQRVDSSGGADNPLVRQMLAMISTAQQRVWFRVPWWDARVSEAAQILEAMLAAKHRGADVRVIVRPDPECEAVIKALRAAGASVKLHRHEHAKELLTEHAQMFLSMNLSRKEIRVNAQNGFVTQDPKALNDAVAAFEAEFDKTQALASAGEEIWKTVEDGVPAALRPFFRHPQLNPLQSKAIPVVLDTDRHVLVVAPTGAGKTVIGEAAALRAIRLEGRKAAWLVPARALANELADLKGRWERLGIRVVSLTGEDNLESEALKEADLWVTTTEKFEALYRRGSLSRAIADIGCLIVDEVHLVGDAARGPTLEALLARLRLLPERTRVVALSATATNADQLAAWLDAELVKTSWRPTQLTTQVITYDEVSSYYANEAAKDAVLRPIVEDFSTVQEDETPGSVLIFMGGKKGVRALAAGLAETPNVADEDALLVDCVKKGVGFHYRGSPRSHAVVNQFRDRQLRVLVATSGLSTGVNTPARAVVVRDLTLGMEEISVAQVLQMFGRAGRAGQEEHGWGFLICPAHLGPLWQQRLSDGYNVTSHIRGRLADALLAEVLLGGVTSVVQAQEWYDGTFAAYLEGADGAVTDLEDVPQSVQLLDELGLVRAGEDGELTATEMGALTCRLMVEVGSAAALLPALAALPLPVDARPAELSLIRALGESVDAFSAPAVNPKDYLALVDELLGRPPSVIPPDGLPTFGADFTVACALLALEQPRRLASRSGLSTLPMRGVVDGLPRYLAWIAALGRLGLHAWAPAVAGDLSRRLAWWELKPEPSRGSGRILWFLEELIPLSERKERMQRAWKWAADHGHRTPDLISESPIKMDPTDFTRLIARRLSPRLGELAKSQEGIVLPVTGSAGSRMQAQLGFQGARVTTTIERQQDGGVVLTPPSTAAGRAKLALDAVWYSNGDAAYQGAILEVDLPEHASPRDPVDDWKLMARGLPQALAVRSDAGRLRRLLHGSKLADLHLVRLATASPELAELARALAGDYGTPHERAHRLRERLSQMLAVAPSDEEERPPTEVLRTLRGSENEHALALAALAGSAGLTPGLAKGATAGRLYALVRLEDRWYVHDGLQPGVNVSLRTLEPPGLGSQLLVLPIPEERPAPVVATATHLSFLEAFLPTA